MSYVGCRNWGKRHHQFKLSLGQRPPLLKEPIKSSNHHGKRRSDLAVSHRVRLRHRIFTFSGDIALDIVLRIRPWLVYSQSRPCLLFSRFCLLEFIVVADGRRNLSGRRVRRAHPGRSGFTISTHLLRDRNPLAMVVRGGLKHDVISHGHGVTGPAPACRLRKLIMLCTTQNNLYGRAAHRPP